MTSLLRKFVSARQRSKSPVKRSPQANYNYAADNEFEHWTRGPETRPPPPLQRLPPQIRTQYVDEDLELQTLTNFQHPYSGNYWHPGTAPSHHHQSTVNGWAATGIQPPLTLLQPPSQGHGSSEYVSMNNNQNTLNTATLRSRESSNDFGRSSSKVHLTEPEYTMTEPRLRSESPQKSPQEVFIHRSRSKSPKKKVPTKSPVSFKQTFDYLHSQCRIEGCSASIIVDDVRFLVCKHQLAHVSEFFRTLFLNNRALTQNGVKQLSTNEYTIVVSSLKHPPQYVQFQWFIECTVPGPVLKDMTDDVLETCMRLSKRFTAKGLEVRCARYIRENVDRKAPMTALCWLNWALKHRFDKLVQESCMLVAARLSLINLEKHRDMVTEKIFADILSAKLRVCFKQTANVFHTIHKMDHFHVEVEKCPRCSRQREQGRIRLLANPCQKLIGCERCLKDLGCEIERKSQDQLQAFYQCDHGLLSFSDETEDCQCQQKYYRRRVDISQPPSEHTFDGEAASSQLN
ncbi:unnamed protein product [Bursaphelenchus xylophilus]|uniref:(pine wood nematode) hypothetical protein n=1 Tax=Bursaphelenchus xylophilus TaxID=6326 RepID=A0A1I7RRQ4_BURXY|nr:unnamed protein product [Bursaphelenchus xylophilus]CAG9123553.1 unnamed protein product [Bursaphelenchus xylophilus]